MEGCERGTKRSSLNISVTQIASTATTIALHNHDLSDIVQFVRKPRISFAIPAAPARGLAMKLLFSGMSRLAVAVCILACSVRSQCSNTHDGAMMLSVSINGYSVDQIGRSEYLNVIDTAAAAIIQSDGQTVGIQTFGGTGSATAVSSATPSKTSAPPTSTITPATRYREP